MPAAWLEPRRLQQQPAAATYLRLLRAPLTRQGMDFESLSTAELMTRTDLNAKRLRSALRHHPP